MSKPGSKGHGKSGHLSGWLRQSKSLSILIPGSFVICFLLGILYEGLKAFRDHLYSKHMDEKEKDTKPKQGIYE